MQHLFFCCKHYYSSVQTIHSDRISFSKYFTTTVEIKNFNVLIDGNLFFFDTLIKNKEKTYEKIVKIRIHNDYATGNILEYEYMNIFKAL